MLDEAQVFAAAEFSNLTNQDRGMQPASQRFNTESRPAIIFDRLLYIRDPRRSKRLPGVICEAPLSDYAAGSFDFGEYAGAQD